MPLVVDIKELIDESLRGRIKRLQGLLENVDVMAAAGKEFCMRGITSPEEAGDLIQLDRELMLAIRRLSERCEKWVDGTEATLENVFERQSEDE